MKSSRGAQVAPAFVVFQIPPPALPAIHTDVLVGSTTMASTRPPILPGPSVVQLLAPEGGSLARTVRSFPFLLACPARLRPADRRLALHRRPLRPPDRS